MRRIVEKIRKKENYQGALSFSRDFTVVSPLQFNSEKKRHDGLDANKITCKGLTLPTSKHNSGKVKEHIFFLII